MPDAPPLSAPLPPPGLLRTLATGLAMGVADAVPGVSGGTIALILGVYHRLLASIASVIDVVRGPFDRARWVAAAGGLTFLVPLYVAVVVAAVLALKLLVGHAPVPGEDAEALRAALAVAPGLLINPSTAPLVFALFFGLVAATCQVPWDQRRTPRWSDLALAGLGAAVAAGLSLSPVLGASPTALVLVLAGALAVSVMLLPGVSGSLTLLVLGLYQPVASGIQAFDLAVAVPFLAGIGLGAALFVPVLRRLLEVAHDRTMAVLAGLMAGSLVALWPWKAHYLPKAIGLLGPMSPTMPVGDWWIPVLLAAAAFVASRRYLR